MPGHSGLCIWGGLFSILVQPVQANVGEIHPSIHSLSVTALSLWWGHEGFCWSRSQLSLGRQLVAGPSLMPEAVMQNHGQTHIRSNLGFSIFLKDTSTCKSAQPGDGIWTSNRLITSWPALPAELQLPMGEICLLIRVIVSTCAAAF